MEIRERLLRNEIRYLSEDVRALSKELITLQDFVKKEFGSKYIRFCQIQRSEIDREDKEDGRPSRNRNEAEVMPPRTRTLGSRKLFQGDHRKHKRVHCEVPRQRASYVDPRSSNVTSGTQSGSEVRKSEPQSPPSIEEDDIMSCGDEVEYREALNNPPTYNVTLISNEEDDPDFDSYIPEDEMNDNSDGDDEYTPERSRKRDSYRIIKNSAPNNDEHTKRGKQKDIIWNFFDKTTEANNWTCKQCKKRVSANATRMKKHKELCDKRHNDAATVTFSTSEPLLPQPFKNSSTS